MVELRLKKFYFIGVCVCVVYSFTKFGFLDKDCRTGENFPTSQISEYERQQGSKLNDHRWFDRIIKMDQNVIQPQLRKRFKAVFRQHKVEIKGKSVLCVGARRGGEVRAFQDLGALAIGIDFNPGERSMHVLYGSASELQFASNVFDILYSNILDHIKDLDRFFEEICRVTRHDALLLLDLDQNAPDKWSVRDLRNEVDELSLQVQNKGWITLSRKVITNEKDRGKIALMFRKSRS